MIAGVDRLQVGQVAAFGLHLDHQLGQGLRQHRDRMTRPQIGAQGQHLRDQPRQLQPPRQGRHRRVRHDQGPRIDPGDRPDLRQQQRPRPVEGAIQRPARGRGVDEDGDPGQGLGRLVRHPLQQAPHEGVGKIHAGGQRVKTAHLSHPAAPRPGGWRRDSPRRTSRRDGSAHAHARPRSSDPTGGSAKRPHRQFRPADRCG